MMATLGDSTLIWAQLTPETAHGAGRVAPRLSFRMLARTPRERMQVQIHVMHGELFAGHEYLGGGILTGARIYPSDTQLTLSIPIDRMSLEHLDSIATGSRVELTLRLSGWLHCCDENTDRPQVADTPAPGEWTFQEFGRGRQVDLPYQIARSDWFTQVLEPLGTSEYICTEIAIPRGDHALRQSANHLNAAERALREGHDPLVFVRCRAAVEALPNAPKDIYAGLSNERERKALDELLHRASNYFHLGRHAADDGPNQGEIVVDHGDAAFALNLAKLLLAHTARVLDRPQR